MEKSEFALVEEDWQEILQKFQIIKSKVIILFRIKSYRKYPSILIPAALINICDSWEQNKEYICSDETDNIYLTDWYVLFYFDNTFFIFSGVHEWIQLLSIPFLLQEKFSTVIRNWLPKWKSRKSPTSGNFFYKFNN